MPSNQILILVFFIICCKILLFNYLSSHYICHSIPFCWELFSSNWAKYPVILSVTIDMWLFNMWLYISGKRAYSSAISWLAVNWLWELLRWLTNLIGWWAGDLACWWTPGGLVNLAGRLGSQVGWWWSVMNTLAACPSTVPMMSCGEGTVALVWPRPYQNRRRMCYPCLFLRLLHIQDLCP